MSAGRSQKLKQVLETVPAGHLVDAAWLTTNGFAYETFRDYVKRGWLERIHRGVFMRPTAGLSKSNTIDWRICVLSMQHIMNYDLHVGGTTALAEQGYEHYLRVGRTIPVWLYGNDIPAWLGKLPLNAQINQRKTSLFDRAEVGLKKQRSDGGDDLPWNWQLKMSAPERAALEALDELPDRESFHNIDMMFESLSTLRPKTLAKLLHSCTKIKVKRLFFVFADRHNHAWRKHLTAEDFGLGYGDRALVKGGKIHPRYRIMVPEEFAKEEVPNAT